MLVINCESSMRAVYGRSDGIEKGVSMVEVKGKWALITGASRGIGFLSAVFMAKRGCNLVLHSRNAGHCKDVVEQIRSYGVEAY